MAFFLARSKRLTKFSNCYENLALFLRGKNNYFNVTEKLFFSQATAILFKDSPHGSGTGDCPKSSGCSSSSNNNDPCKPRIGSSCVSEVSSMKNSCENSPKRTKEDCEKISTISPKDPCSMDCEKSKNLSSSNSPLDDPCPRDCKLSIPLPCPDSPPRKKICPEPPPPYGSPTTEDAKKQRFWRNATIFGALPAVLIAALVINVKSEEESMKPREKYVPRDYMYRRTKRFPWGDGNHSLFHNPVKNPVPPDGYEVEDPHENKKKN